MFPYGRHIYAKATDMENSTMCTYHQSDHALTHWKCVLWCCSNCTCINLPDQEIDKKHEKQHPQLGFTFITSLRCTDHGIIPLKKRKNMLYI